jgi:hypothetical protein
MILISHRGNLGGPCFPTEENKPEYIDAAIAKGFDVEVDVWELKGCIFLGHDDPDHQIPLSWLVDRQDKLWCHAKNLDALHTMVDVGLNCFFHNTDDFTLTSKGFIWTYPQKPVTTRSILVHPELTPNLNVLDVAGVCSDFIECWQYPDWNNKGR